MDKAVILAGGAGTRLKSLAGDVPKCMVKIAGKPIIEWQLLCLGENSIKDITIVTNHKYREHFAYLEQKPSAFRVEAIHIIYEKEPLGTGGALLPFKGKGLGEFAFVFGDIMFDVDFSKFVDFHHEHKSMVTALSHPNDHPFDSDLLIVDIDDRIQSISRKSEPRTTPYPNLTNAGLYVVSEAILEYVPEGVKTDFEKDIIAKHLDLPVYAYSSSEYVKDCGTPERFKEVEDDIKKGIVKAKNLSRPQKCIFLDRDGTINEFGDFVTSMDKLILKKDASEAIKMINRSEYLAVVITNQPVVARGETSIEELDRIHMKLYDELGQGGAYLNGLYYCPHHPDKGFEGERPEYKIACDCRKPNIGLIKKAQKRFNIDLSQSWFVGDTSQDVQTGINAGCRTIRLTCGDPRINKRYESAKADYVCASLLEAVKTILEE